MKSAFKKVVCAVMAFAMIVGAMFTLASCGKNYAENNTEFKIGMSGPLTGAAAVYGIAVKNGASLAIKEINAKGGIFGKYKIAFLTYDDKHDPTLVETGFYNQYEAGMQASLGCVTSGPCAEFVGLSKENNVFFITPSASNDEIPKEFNGYQMCFADGNQGKAAAAFVEEKYAGKTIGMLYCSGDNYSEGIKDQFKANLTTVSVTEASFLDGATDFSSQVEILKNCEFVFMPIYYTPAAQFMTEAKKHANSFKVFYGCDGFDGIETGVQGFSVDDIPQEISYLSHFNAKATDGAAKTFIDAFKAEYNEDPIQFAAGAYDCVYAIVKAIEANGEDKFSVNMSAKDVCKMLNNTFDNTDFMLTGATGTDMSWNKPGNSGYGFVEKSADKYVVKDATFPD